MRQKGWALGVKRLLDATAAAVLLLITSPLLAAVAVASRLLLGTPVLFRQQRPGRHAVPFEIYKFRTMTQELGPDGRLLPDVQRLTRYGRLLRATSLDELPQFFNVLKGELSLVGPRPLLMQYLGRYTEEQARRHDVLPGVTGWAQINGRNAITWPEKFALDVWYVDHWSLFLDFRILATTAMKVLRRDGISSAESATMPEFMGEGGDVR